MAICLVWRHFRSRLVCMVASSDQQSTSLAASLLALLSAIALMAVVTAVVVCAIKLKDDRTSTVVGSADPKELAEAEKASPVLIAMEPPQTVQASGSEGSEQLTSVEVKADASPSP